MHDMAELTPEILTHEQAHRQLRDAFRAAALATPELDARVLLAAATRLDDTQLALQAEAPIDAAAHAQLLTWQAQRIQGAPVSRLIGQRGFYGRTFKINRHVLDPRPDSELLVETVLAARAASQSPQRVLDLGTGSGCLIISLLAEAGPWSGVGLDASRQALAMARANAHRLGVRDRLHLRHSHWFDAVTKSDGLFDVIISNPPYIRREDIAALDIEVRAHDPLMALDGGVDGLRDYRLITQAAAAYLKAGGGLYFEIGHDQADAVGTMMQKAGFVGLQVRQDLAGRDRLVSGQKKV